MTTFAATVYSTTDLVTKIPVIERGHFGAINFNFDIP